jgi:hypothetical protein
MSEQLTTILLNTALILLILGLWGAAIAFVAWDTTRRNLSGGQRFIWVGLAVIPLLGLAAYLIVRPFFRPAPANSTAAREPSKEWQTILKPAAAGAPKRLPTIPAAEYLRAAAQADKRKAGPGRTAAEPKRNAEYVLLVTEGPHAGEYFVVDKLPAAIGRGDDCTIRLDNDHGVSRRHAELYWQGGTLRLRDLGSTHGTSVNGYKIDKKDLTPGDKIRLGYSLLIVKTER